MEKNGFGSERAGDPRGAGRTEGVAAVGWMTGPERAVMARWSTLPARFAANDEGPKKDRFGSLVERL